jgi:hypothetical protein
MTARLRPLKPLPAYRQSLVTAHAICPRRTRFALQGRGDYATGYTESSADLGTVFHAVAAEILRTLKAAGEQQIPTQEAMEVMFEVVANGSIVLPPDERDDLRWLVLKFCDLRWNPHRIFAIERRLSTEVAGQDGVLRTFTGQPDVILAVPPDLAVLYDLKSGRGQPKAPRKPPEPGEVVVGKQYLSDRGHAQLDSYGLLVMREWPTVFHRVALHEVHMRSGQIREAFLTRAELEHVERQIGTQMQQLERGIMEGPRSELWRPKAGAHCARQCPVSRSCPIPREQRGLGVLDTPAQADAEAARFMAVDGLRGQMRDALKAKHEAGYSPRTPDGLEFRWRQDPKNPARRNFGAWPPEPAPEPAANASSSRGSRQSERKRRGPAA